MTATERIRAMLDEREVEWMPSAWSARDETFYKVGNTGFLATEMSGGRMKVCIEGYVVPEQAVEATLGRGECRDIEDSGTDFCCSACGARLYIDTGDTYTMIAADEHTIIKRPNYCPNCGARVVRA